MRSGTGGRTHHRFRQDAGVVGVRAWIDQRWPSGVYSGWVVNLRGLFEARYLSQVIGLRLTTVETSL